MKNPDILKIQCHYPFNCCFSPVMQIFSYSNLKVPYTVLCLVCVLEICFSFSLFLRCSQLTEFSQANIFHVAVLRIFQYFVKTKFYFCSYAHCPINASDR
jgi:hypothetical protein